MSEADLQRKLDKLQAGLKDNEEIIRYYAAAELGELGEHAQSAVPALQAALGDRCHSVRRVAAWALTRIDPDALNHLPLAKRSLIEKIIAFCTTLPLRWRRRKTFNPEEYLPEPLER
jgi:hypothetical protein